MNKWEAKYKVLATGATDEQVEVAERLVKVAIDMHTSTILPFNQIFNALLETVQLKQASETKVLLNEI